MTGTTWLERNQAFSKPRSEIKPIPIVLGVVRDAVLKMVCGYGIGTRREECGTLILSAETYDGFLNDILMEFMVKARNMYLEAINNAAFW